MVQLPARLPPRSGPEPRVPSGEGARSGDLRPRWRVPLAVATSIVFLCLSIANLCYPEARGLKDQGDFVRVFGSFSTGPGNWPLWPSTEDPVWRVRFGSYLRYWRLDGELPGWHRPLSTSRWIYLPERLVARALGSRAFDLARNTALVLAITSVVVVAALLVQTNLVVAATLAAIVLLFADFRLGWVLNSFYQESGAYVFTLWLLCALFAWLARRTTALLVASLLLAGVLALTKVVYVPSVLVVLATIVVVAWRCAPERRRAVAALALVISAVVAVVSFRLDGTRHAFGADVAFNFVFLGALPALPAESRGPFLAGVGVDPARATLAGRSVYEVKDEPGLEETKRAIVRHGHAATIVRLARTEPAAFTRLVSHGVAATGAYDLGREGYAWRAPGLDGAEPFSWRAWSALRERLLPGWWGYGATALLLLALGWRVRGSRDEWPWACLVLASGLALGSLGQVAVAILGNGTGDLVKHLYLANLLLDVALLLLAGGLARVQEPGSVVRL